MTYFEKIVIKLLVHIAINTARGPATREGIYQEFFHLVTGQSNTQQ